MNTPLVSVCCITFNHAKFIAQCIEGLLIQKTTFPIEILIFDDASQDETQAILKAYSAKHPHIITFLQTENQWVNKKYGLTDFLFPNAKGKYIALCEGDDYWTDPYKLQKQADFLEAHPDFVLTGHDAQIIDQNGKIVQDSKLPDAYKRDASSEELKKGFWVLTLSVLVRNVEVVKKYPIEGYKAPNGDTFLNSILGQYGGFHYMPEVNPAAYRKHHGGLWSNLERKKKLQNQNLTYEALKEYYEKKGDQELVDHYTKLIDLNKIKQFDHSMNNERFRAKTKMYFKTLSTNKNWKNRKRFIYLNKVFLKSILK